MNFAGYKEDNLTVHYPANFVKAYWILMSSGVLVVLMGLGFYIHSKTSKGVKLTDHIPANSIRTFRQVFFHVMLSNKTTARCNAPTHAIHTYRLYFSPRPGLQ